MNPEPNRLESIVAAAVAQPAEARAAYLDQACGADAALRLTGGWKTVRPR